MLAASSDNADALSLALAEPPREQLKQAIVKHPAHVGIALDLARRAVALELDLALGDLYLQGNRSGSRGKYRRALPIELDHGAATGVGVDTGKGSGSGQNS